MAVFGGYETVRELFRSGLASASTAKKVGGDASDRFVIKCYQPLALEDSDERLQGEVESFLDGARTQQKAAAQGGAHWAGVHEVGTVEGGAYFVTDNHHRSVQHLIRGRVRLRGGGLYHIVRSVVEGLIELDRACQRPHGNLKPSNILLTGKSDISRATPLLTDPVGASHLDPQMGNVGDLHALGELIYQLVLHRTGKAMGGYPAPDAKEWAALGKNGTTWRQLCNRLLNPNLAPGLLTLEDLAGDIDKLRERVSGPSMKVMVAAGLLAAVVVVGIAVGFFLPRNGAQPTGNFNAEAWQRLCSEYGGWVEPLLGQKQSGALKAWESDKHLCDKVLPILSEVIQKIKEINPRLIARYGGNLEFLGENPTEEAQSDEAFKQTARALAIIDRLRAALSKDNWATCRALTNHAERLRERGWDGAADYIEGLQPFSEKDLVARVHAILAAQASVTQIDAKWREVQVLQGKLEAWGQGSPKPLARFGEYVQAATAMPADVMGAKALTKEQEKLRDFLDPNSLPRRLADFLGSLQSSGTKLDWTLLAKEPPFVVPAGGKMTDKILREGLARLASDYYGTRPDPRTPEWKGKIDDGLKNRETDIGNLEERIKKINDDYLAKGTLPADFASDITSRVDAVREQRKKCRTECQDANDLYRKLLDIQAYNSSTRVEVDTGKARVDSLLKGLAGRVTASMGRVAKIEDDIAAKVQGTLEQVRDRLTRRTKISPTGLAEIDQPWRNWVLEGNDSLLKTETAAKALSDKAKLIESFLLDLEKRFPDAPVVKKENERPWNRALVTAETESLRKNAVSTCVSFADRKKILAGSPDTNFTENRDHQVDVYAAWRTGLAKIIPAFNRIEDALTSGYLLTEKPPLLAMTLGEFAAKHRGEAILQYAAVLRAVKPMTDRLDALGQVASLNDAQRLLTLAGAGKQKQFETARAAWLRLSKLGKPWPATPAQMKQEIEARKNLSAVYALGSDAARKATLQKELATESPRRWETYFLALTDIGQIEDAVAQRSEFGVTIAALSPPARFRLAMFDFRRALAAQPGKLPDPQVKKAIADLLATMGLLPAAFRQRADVAAMTSALDEIRRQTVGSGMDLATAGLAALGYWKASRPSPDTVRYAWDEQKETLTFRRVAPKGQKPCFLCTTEVSVGLFRKVVLNPRANRWNEVAKLLGTDDDKYGPRTWTGTTGPIALSNSWLASPLPPPLINKVYLPATDPGAVTAEHPMQQVSLAAAIYFARLMNCRLPTSGEWLAAYAADKTAGGGKPYNLRDKTWADQKAHAIQLEDAGDLMDRQQYFPDAGVFWPKTIAADQRKLEREAESHPGAPTDGFLWFDKVGTDTGRPFRHLVGNVAEFVYDAPGAVQAIKTMTPEAIQGLLKTPAGGASARVIGASAISPPQVPRDKPQAIGSPAEKEGFSDVGLRLAFSAGPERLQSRVLRLLKGLANQGYLSATPP